MTVHLTTPNYKDVFGADPPQRYLTFEGLDIRPFITRLAHLTWAMQGSHALSNEKELVFIRGCYDSEADSDYQQLLHYVATQRVKQNLTAIFNRNTCLLFIAALLRLGNEVDMEADEIQALQGAEFMRYYLAFEWKIAAEDHSLILRLQKLKKDDSNFLQRYLWPALIKTHWVGRKRDFLLELFKTAYALKYLLDQPRYSAYVQSYLGKVKCESIYELFSRFLSIQRYLFDPASQGPFLTSSNDGFAPILDIWSRLPSDIGSLTDEGLAVVFTKPIIKLPKDRYLILDRDVLLVGLYDSVLRTLYHTTGIEKETGGFDSFKGILSSNVIEGTLFRRLIRYVFDHKYDTVTYPKTDDTGDPDALVVSKGDTYIFELKDASMPYSNIMKRDAELILSDVTKKFVRDPKRPNRGAAIQLVRYTATAFANVQRPRPDRTYPIVVFTDTMYAMPGINDVVAESFDRLAVEQGLAKTRPLWMISLDYLFACAFVLKRGQLKQRLTNLSRVKLKSKNNHGKSHTVEDAVRMSQTLEDGAWSEVHAGYADPTFVRYVLGDIFPADSAPNATEP